MHNVGKVTAYRKLKGRNSSFYVFCSPDPTTNFETMNPEFLRYTVELGNKEPFGHPKIVP